MNAPPSGGDFKTDDPVDDLSGSTMGAGAVLGRRRLMILAMLFVAALALVWVITSFSRVPGMTALGGILAIVLPVAGVVAERRVRRTAKCAKRHSLDPV